LKIYFVFFYEIVGRTAFQETAKQIDEIVPIEKGAI